MAHALSITDGTTTFSLSTTSCALTQYTPAEPQAKEATVTETIELIFYAASVAAMRTAIESLQRLIDTAHRKQAWGVGPAVYLLYQPDGDASAWRSEILAARFEYDVDTLRAWGQAKMPASLIIERDAVREGALVQIPLTNTNGTNNTAGLTVCLHDDGGAGNDNHVQIATSGVTGSLPTPLILELTNNTGSSVQYSQIHMATNAFSDPANFVHVLQAEVGLATGGSITSDATCSNTGYVGRTFTSTDVQQYNLTAAMLQAARGYDVHLLARFKSITGAVYVRPSIYDSTGTFILWRGAEVELPLLSPAVADLGVMPMPPGGYSTAWGGLRLHLAWRGTGTITTETDFFGFWPAATYRRLQVLATVANAATIVDDPTEGRAYVRASSVEIPAVSPQGLPLLVWPNTLQRVYFTWSLLNLSAPVTSTLSVKAWCRPRRLTF